MTARAHRIGPMLCHLLAHRLGLFTLGGFFELWNIRGRWRHWRAENVVEHPLAADDRRCPFRVRRHGEHAALAEQSEPPFVGKRDTAKAAAVDTGDAVV